MASMIQGQRGYNYPWSYELDKKCREMSAKNCSASEIAKALVVKTRNAVIGYCKRKKIPLSRRPPKPFVIKQTRQTNQKISLPHKEPLKKFPSMLLIDATPDTCRMIIGEVNALKTRVCAYRTVSGFSYCEDHFREVHK